MKSHCLQGFSTIPGGWLWDSWTINSICPSFLQVFFFTQCPKLIARTSFTVPGWKPYHRIQEVFLLQRRGTWPCSCVPKTMLPVAWALVRSHSPGSLVKFSWECCGVAVVDNCNYSLQKLTWNPKMEVWKMIFLFKHVIFRFHVSFRGVSILISGLFFRESLWRDGTCDPLQKLVATYWKKYLELVWISIKIHR